MTRWAVPEDVPEDVPVDAAPAPAVAYTFTRYVVRSMQYYALTDARQVIAQYPATAQVPVQDSGPVLAPIPQSASLQEGGSSKTLTQP